jgi:[acyl-carrier-protein] S-malonyltransferase
MAHTLSQIQLLEMQIPVACNVDAKLVDKPSAARDALVRQVTGTVRWEPCMRLLIAQGVGTFVEVGPGKVLCGLMRQIDRHKTCLNVEDEASLQKTLHHVSAKDHVGTGALARPGAT